MKKSIRLAFAFLALCTQQHLNAQWTPLNSGTTQTLKGIDMLDPARGVAVGENGTVLRTLDGGDTWQPIGSNTLGSLRSVVMLNNDHILVGGGDIFSGGVFQTLDGGMHWDSVAVGADLARTGFGIFALHHNGVFLSTDQGHSWQSTNISIGGTTLPERLRFPDDHTGYVCGNLSGFAGYFNYGYRSDDAGQNWSELYPFDFPSGEAYTAAHYPSADTGFYFLNQNVGFLPGPVNKLVKVQGFHYDDTPGVEAWRFTGEDVNSQMPAYINDGYFSNNSKGWAAGNNGLLYATADGGLTWQPVYQNNQPLWSIEALYNTPAFVVGEGGLILRNEAITGLPAEPADLPITLYPNPANDKVQVEWPAGISQAQLSCYDALGRLIMQKSLNAGDSFEVNAWPEGSYSIRLSAANQHWASRLLVIRQ